MHCTLLHQICWREPSPLSWWANRGKALRKGGMKLQLAKSGLAFDHLIMKSNYRQSQQGSLFFSFYLSKNPGCPGALMRVVRDSFEHCFLFWSSSDFSVTFFKTSLRTDDVFWFVTEKQRASQVFQISKGEQAVEQLLCKEVGLCPTSRWVACVHHLSIAFSI